MRCSHKLSVVTILTLVLSACATLTPTSEVSEGYRIYDIKGTSNYSAVAANLKNTLQKNVDKVRFTNNIPPHPLPEKPGRFELTNPFTGTIIAAQGPSIKWPQCKDAIFTAMSNENFQGVENTTFFVCLMPYTNGCHMDVYYAFTKVSGGYSPEAIGKTLAQSMVGDSSQFIPRTLAALESTVKESGAQISLVEFYP